jgi:organic radical activating enzyme
VDQKGANSSFIYEVFSGIQGEGPLVGERQIFIRFCTCNLRCRYCDARSAGRPVRQARLELSPGSRQFELVPNPLSLEVLLAAVRRLDDPTGLHHSVSLTGGEPLLHASFLAGLLPALHKIGLKNYLETNGTLPAALARILDDVDIVASDVKLPSATGQRGRFQINRRFLRIAAKRGCIVKVVVASRSTEGELRRVGQMVRETNPEGIVILQPVTRARGASPPSPAQMLEFQRIVKEYVSAVRVIPQVHKLIGQL